MQAMIKRSARIKTNLNKKQELIKRNREAYDNMQDQAQLVKAVNKKKKREGQQLKAAVEDWKLGPLAPKRNISSAPLDYGALPREEFLAKDLTKRNRELSMAMPQPGSTSMLSYFRKKDRVVIIRGQGRGNIGTVDSVDRETRTLTLSSLNKAYALMDEISRKWFGMGDIPPGGQPQSLFIPMRNVRLVADLNGKDVIVDKMLVEVPKSGWIQKYNLPLDERVVRRIPGTLEDIDGDRYARQNLSREDLEVKLTAEKEARDAEKEDFEVLPSNTTKEDVEARTWHPSLNQLPMPPTLIDELRNKYSASRTRHDDEYLEKLIAIDERKALKVKTGKLMLRTPEKEFAIEQRSAARQVAKQRTISAESMALLASSMEKNLDAAKKKKLLQSLDHQPPAASTRPIFTAGRGHRGSSPKKSITLRRTSSKEVRAQV